MIKNCILEIDSKSKLQSQTGEKTLTFIHKRGYKKSNIMELQVSETILTSTLSKDI